MNPTDRPCSCVIRTRIPILIFLPFLLLLLIIKLYLSLATSLHQMRKRQKKRKERTVCVSVDNNKIRDSDCRVTHYSYFLLCEGKQQQQNRSKNLLNYESGSSFGCRHQTDDLLPLPKVEGRKGKKKVCTVDVCNYKLESGGALRYLYGFEILVTSRKGGTYKQ
jgi:hypothetical protein